MNSWTDKEMNQLTILVFIALSVSLALFLTIPKYIIDVKEHIEILQEKIEILESNNG